MGLATVAGMSTFDGPVFRPGDDGYDAERTGFNLSLEHHPELIVGATSPDDVIAAVDYATEQGLAVAVQTTGHGPSVPADGQVMITMHRVDDVQVDPATRTARVGGGARWQQVLPQTVPHGLAPLNGSSPTVGVVGYTLGGGIGPLGRAFGFAADRVRRIDLVTADGQLRQVTADSEPDLFWALRGGKGNFGVVVGLEFELVPVSRLYGGGLLFAADAARDVLHAYSEWTQTVPDEMCSSVLLAQFPPLPQIPELLRGRYVAGVRLAYTGSADEGERLVKPLRDVAPSLLDTLGELPYADVASIYNDPTEPAATSDSSMGLHTVDADAVEAILAQVGPDSGSPLLAELRQLGGAYAQPPAIASAVGGRDIAWVLFAVGLLRPGNENALREAHDALEEAMRPWATEAKVQNFIGPRDAAPERAKLAFAPADFTRLTQVKATYDPGNMFRININVPPAGTR